MVVALTQTISRIGTIFFCLSAVCSSLIIFITVRYQLNNDLIEFVLPWFTRLTQHGLQAISGTYSNYAPTYLYLLATVSPLHPVISDVVLIKSVSMAFAVVAAFIVYLRSEERRVGKECIYL